jgi:hypothetical protein
VDYPEDDEEEPEEQDDSVSAGIANNDLEREEPVSKRPRLT